MARSRRIQRGRSGSLAEESRKQLGQGVRLKGDRPLVPVARYSADAFALAAPQPRATVLEFASVSVKPADVQKRAIALTGPEAAPANLLLARRRTMRDQFLKHVAGMRAQLDR